MAVTGKQFQCLDARGTSGFVYDANGNDISSEAAKQKITAIYLVSIDNGPWKYKSIAYTVHESGTEQEINSALES